jgi:hypothetical protein
MVARKRRKADAWHALLGAPFVGLLWVPFYNRRDPELAGFPYFYWYQFAWIGISAALTAVVYFATRDRDR